MVETGQRNENRCPRLRSWPTGFNLRKTLPSQENQHDPVQLLIICGDFQAIRNPVDMQSMVSFSAKHHIIGDFHQYYSGHKLAPILTLIIGGNHENWPYFTELHYGGWLAPRISYIGRAGCIQVRFPPDPQIGKCEKLRIAGISGVDQQEYNRDKGLFEVQPYSKKDSFSVYQIRDFDVERVGMIWYDLDIFVSHEWPHNIHLHQGDSHKFMRERPQLKSLVKNETLGSPMLSYLLDMLKPRFWFAAHRHAHFQTLVQHSSRSGSDPSGSKKRARNGSTVFEAFDQCGDDKIHLKEFDIHPEALISEFVENPENEDDMPKLLYDPEWLAIIKATNEYLSVKKRQPPLPDLKIDRTWQWIHEYITDFTVPLDFFETAPSMHGDPSYELTDDEQEDAHRVHINPQTTAFCSMLDIHNPFVNFVQIPKSH